VIRISRNADDRCTGGASSGAIAAFTMALERSDSFHRVFSAIGTYVGMRGGDRYPVLVRKTESKPLRVFLQDGSNDQWDGGPEMGDWWMSNQTMERALAFSGYQVEHVWGSGDHSWRDATAMFPDAMRWLWKNWPQPVAAGESQNLFLRAILAKHETWREIGGAYSSATALTANPAGGVMFQDEKANTAWRITAGDAVEPAPAFAASAAAAVHGPDGRYFVADSRAASIVALAADRKRITIADGIHGRQMVVTHDGRIYVTGAENVWLITGDGNKVVVDTGLDHASSLVLSPDGLWLAVAEEATHGGYSYAVQPDGTLAARQRFYWFHVPDWAESSAAAGWCADRDGRLYAATNLGVQVFDRNGRVRAILPVPGGVATGICFGGADFASLYVVAGNKVYCRKMNIRGAPGWLAPIDLPPWGAG
jgi:sugar lactone lactonase YvrE